MNARLVSYLGALVLGTSAVTAAADEQKEIRELYRRSLVGDKASVEQCIAKLEIVLKREPTNQLARVYLGSAYTLRSRDLGFGLKKLQVLKQGLAVMDEAVGAAPEEPKVRLVRALTTSAIPSIFGRVAESRQDFLLLAGMANDSPGRFDESDLQEIYYHSGLAAKSAGDPARAQLLWRKALAHSVDPSLAGRVRAELAFL